jgi:large subunit ribosomal protein L5
MERLKQKYHSEVRPQLKDELGLGNVMAVPRLQKITVSMGLGNYKEDKKVIEEATNHLTVITGQKPVICKARKSVSNFKLREGNLVGLKVTLRKERMFEFLDRLVSVTIPRVRDFRGLNPDGFDGRGNFNMGLTEFNVFAEIDPDSIETRLGMNITFTTTADDDESARQLLTKLGMPFRREGEDN